MKMRIRLFLEGVFICLCVPHVFLTILRSKVLVGKKKRLRFFRQGLQTRWISRVKPFQLSPEKDWKVHMFLGKKGWNMMKTLPMFTQESLHLKKILKQISTIHLATPPKCSQSSDIIFTENVCLRLISSDDSGNVYFPKTNMSPENTWLEDDISCWSSPFLGDMFFFGGVSLEFFQHQCCLFGCVSAFEIPMCVCHVS